MTPTNTLTDFLRARINEDRLAAIRSMPGPWSIIDDRGPEGTAHSLYSQGGYYISRTLINRPTAELIARHDPTRVLAECQAKRRVIDAYQQDVSGTPSVNAYWYAMCCLAAPYADHPDYQEEWRP